MKGAVGLVLVAGCASFGTSGFPGTDAGGDGGDVGDAGAEYTTTRSDASADGDAGGECTFAVLLGDANDTGKANDSIPSTTMDLFGYTRVGATVTATCVWVYLVSAPSRVEVGVYDDANGPKSLQARATLPSSPAAGWYAAKLDKPVTVRSGASIWIGLLPEESLVDRIRTSCLETPLYRRSVNPASSPPTQITSIFNVDKSHCDLSAFLSP